MRRGREASFWAANMLFGKTWISEIPATQPNSHLPLMQASWTWQVLPQSPQFFGSFTVSTQAPLQTLPGQVVPSGLLTVPSGLLIVPSVLSLWSTVALEQVPETHCKPELQVLSSKQGPPSVPFGLVVVSSLQPPRTVQRERARERGLFVAWASPDRGLGVRA